VKKISGRYSLPWLTRDIKHLIRRKQRAYNRAKKSHRDRDWTLFRKQKLKLRKKTQTLMKSSHWDYLNNLFTEDDGNQKSSGVI